MGKQRIVMGVIASAAVLSTVSFAIVPALADDHAARSATPSPTSATANAQAASATAPRATAPPATAPLTAVPLAAAPSPAVPSPTVPALPALSGLDLSSLVSGLLDAVKNLLSQLGLVGPILAPLAGNHSDSPGSVVVATSGSSGTVPNVDELTSSLTKSLSAFIDGLTAGLTPKFSAAPASKPADDGLAQQQDGVVVRNLERAAQRVAAAAKALNAATGSH